MHWLDTGLRAAVVSQLLFVIVLLARAGWPVSPPRLCAMLLSLGVGAYMVCSAPAVPALGIAGLPVLLLCVANPVFFWWFAGAVFEDSFRLRLVHGAGLVLMLGVGLAAHHSSELPLPVASALRTAGRILAFGFLLAGLWTAMRDRAGDLLETRRRFRDWFTLAVGLYMLIVVGAELALAGSTPPPHVGVLNVAVILLISHWAAHAFVRFQGGGLLTLASEPAGRTEPTAESEPLLQRLRQAIEVERAYRQEGLGIAALAQRLGTQERTLRRVINQNLGFRNFNEFLNSYRVREAVERLRQPSDRRLPVLTIALEVGYGSIGPFNRAFKELMGMTPTEFRRSLAPSPEDPSRET